jgi:phage gpG-like protein
MPLRNVQNGKEFSQEQKENLQKLDNLIGKRLPEKVVDEAQKIVDESFKKEQYQDKSSPQWKSRKKDKESGKARESRRALLVKSSALIRSIETDQRGSDIVIHTDVPYAQVHNEGLRAGKGAGFQMPQREFMPIPGESNPLLDERVEKWLDDEMDKIFK